jgi:methylmalonyl-CoA/ethylmalonyl-CoA epimerase
MCGVNTSHQSGYEENSYMPKIKKINHVAIVVEHIEDALPFWRDGLGLEIKQYQDVPEQESRVAFLPLGESEIELVEPTSDNSGISRYLKKRGPGMHHVCFEVEDIQDSLQQLMNKGFRLINDTPQVSEDGSKYLFIHPESTNGVLVELYELPTDGK